MSSFPLPLPDAEFLKKSIWQSFSFKDLVYAAILSFMLMNQHFNNEQRLEKLENSNVQIAETLSKMSVKIDTEMVPRKEHDAANTALNIRLGNIETGENNVMTYLLNHGK